VIEVEKNKKQSRAMYEEPPAAAIKVYKKVGGGPLGGQKAGGDKKEPQMVTIRRVMEPRSSEPTVTITLKGDTPDHDKSSSPSSTDKVQINNFGHKVLDQ